MTDLKTTLQIKCSACNMDASITDLVSHPTATKTRYPTRLRLDFPPNDLKTVRSTGKRGFLLRI
jgi:hypothetical protein